MNTERRRKLTGIASQLDGLKDELEALQSEEQEAFDALPESLQTTNKGELSEEASATLAEAVGGLDDVITMIEEAKG